MATKLLCHFDGTDGQTTTTDSSLSAHTLTMTNCTLSTANAKFGTAALNVDTGATTGRVTAPDHADWNFGAGQFTIEAWVKFSSTGAGTQAICAQFGVGFDSSFIFSNNFSNISFIYSTDGFATTQISAAWTPTLGQYYHLAVDRDASNLIRLYVDGVVMASATAAVTFFNATQNLSIGNDSVGNRFLDGYIDELRISDVAIYAGAFTPPTEPFPDPAVPAAEVRVTQAPMLVLSAADSDARVTQAAVLALAELIVTAPIRVTQAAALALAEFDAGIRVTQSAVLVLADHIPCVQRWATCWTFTRTDGLVLGYTSHDQTVSFRGVDHVPCNSLAASAVEMSSIVGSTGSIDLIGLLSDAGVSEKDIYNGLYDGANIEVWLVPWSNAGGETPIRLIAGVVGANGHETASYRQELLTEGQRLQQRALLETITPGCRFLFGNQVDPRCPVDLSLLEVTGSVTALAIPNASTDSARRIFSDSTRLEADGYFSLGRVTWTTGANVGAISEVKDFIGGQFILWESLLNHIALTDAYIATPGCDKSPAAHLTFEPDMKKFGGFPFVSGPDMLVRRPDAKG